MSSTRHKSICVLPLVSQSSQAMAIINSRKIEQDESKGDIVTASVNSGQNGKADVKQFRPRQHWRRDRFYWVMLLNKSTCTTTRIQDVLARSMSIRRSSFLRTFTLVRPTTDSFESSACTGGRLPYVWCTPSCLVHSCNRTIARQQSPEPSLSTVDRHCLDGPYRSVKIV